MDKRPITGAFRHRVSIQRNSAPPAQRGQPERIYTELGEFYANVTQVSGEESINANQLKAFNSWQVIMRNEFVPRPTDRVVWQGRTLEVVTSKLDLVGNFLSLDCKELAKQTA